MHEVVRVQGVVAFTHVRRILVFLASLMAVYISDVG